MYHIMQYHNVSYEFHTKITDAALVGVLKDVNSKGRKTQKVMPLHCFMQK